MPLPGALNVPTQNEFFWWKLIELNTSISFVFELGSYFWYCLIREQNQLGDGKNFEIEEYDSLVMLYSFFSTR